MPLPSISLSFQPLLALKQNRTSRSSTLPVDTVPMKSRFKVEDDRERLQFDVMSSLELTLLATFT